MPTKKRKTEGKSRIEKRQGKQQKRKREGNLDKSLHGARRSRREMSCVYVDRKQGGLTREASDPIPVV